MQDSWVNDMHIRPALFPTEAEAVRALFLEYAQAIGVDLCFQGFQEELDALPGKYASPQGCVLVAMSGALTLGCVALRPIDGQRGEMKRLYVRPGARGQRLGSALAQAICAEARRAGYREICLDTLASMTTAVALYRSLGFREIEPYLFNPLPGALYFGLALD